MSIRQESAAVRARFEGTIEHQANMIEFTVRMNSGCDQLLEHAAHCTASA